MELEENDISDPEDRWSVANNTDLGKRLIKTFLKRMFSEPLGFFDSPKPDGQPILEGFNDFLNAIEAYDYFMRSGTRLFTHGWQITRPELIHEIANNPQSPIIGINLMKCWGEHEVPVRNFIRATQADENQSIAMQEMYGTVDPTTGKPIELIHKNDITGYRVAFVPELPMYRGTENLQAYVQEVYEKKEIFHTTLGQWNYGVGDSELEAVFDSIVKITEQSENNHFRQSLFAQAVLDPSFEEQEAKDWVANATYAMNHKQILANFPILDSSGNPIPGVPSLNFASGVKDVPTRATSGGAGVFADLSSDWAHLCGETGYSIRYFTGNPGGALAAADNDSLNDINNDIYRASLLIKHHIRPFFKLLQSLGVLPPTIDFNKVYIKTHWEMKRDQKDLVELQKTQLSLQQQQVALQTAANPPQLAKENKHEELLDSKMNESPKFEYEFDVWIDKGFESDFKQMLRNKFDIQSYDYQKIKEDAEGSRYSITVYSFEEIQLIPNLHWDVHAVHKKDITREFHFAMNELVEKANSYLENLLTSPLETAILLHPNWSVCRKNASNPNLQWQPVNSDSGNVVSAAMDMPGGNSPPKIYVKFKGGREYSYQDDEAFYGRGKTPDKIFGEILDQGGEAIWENLRAPISLRAPYLVQKQTDPQGYQDGKYRQPSGLAKTGTGNFPWAGSPHYAEYQIESNPGGSGRKGVGKAKALSDVMQMLKEVQKQPKGQKLASPSKESTQQTNPTFKSSSITSPSQKTTLSSTSTPSTKLTSAEFGAKSLLNPTEVSIPTSTSLKQITEVGSTPSQIQGETEVSPQLLNPSLKSVSTNIPTSVSPVSSISSANLPNPSTSFTTSSQTPSDLNIPSANLPSRIDIGSSQLPTQEAVDTVKGFDETLKSGVIGATSSRQIGSQKAAQISEEEIKSETEAEKRERLKQEKARQTAEQTPSNISTSSQTTTSPLTSEQIVSEKPSKSTTEESISLLQLFKQIQKKIILLSDSLQDMDVPILRDALVNASKQLPKIEEVIKTKDISEKLAQEGNIALTTLDELFLVSKMKMLQTFLDRIRIEIPIINRPQQAKPLSSLTTPAESTTPELSAIYRVKDRLIGRRSFGGKRNEIPEEILKDDVRYWFDSINTVAKDFHHDKKTVMNAIVRENVAERRQLIEGTLQKQDDEFWYIISNGFSIKNPFQYLVNGRIRTEYQCPISIRKNVGRKVAHGIYHNLENMEKVDLPESQTVGTFEILSYDEEKGEDVSLIKVNKQKVAEYFQKRNESDWITPKLNKGDVPDISTAYLCKVHFDDTKRIYLQTDFLIASCSFVPKGNCSAPFCQQTLLRANASMKACILTKIPEIRKAHPELDYEEVIKNAAESCRLSPKENGEWSDRAKDIKERHKLAIFNIPLDEIDPAEMPNPFDPTRSSVEWLRKTDVKDWPPIILDHAHHVVDGVHRYFVAKEKNCSEIKAKYSEDMTEVEREQCKKQNETNAKSKKD